MLDPGDQYEVVFTVNIDPNDAAAPATLQNTATGGGTAPGGALVTDDSNSGTDLAGGSTGELPGSNPGGPGTPTPVAPPSPAPELGVVKSATNIGALQSDGTFDVTYSVLVANTGNVRLTPLTLTDDLSATAALSGAFNSVVTAPAVTLTTNTSGSAIAPTTACLLYTSPSPRDQRGSRMPSSA